MTSGWTTVEQSNKEVAPKVGRKRAMPQVKKKSVLGKRFAKAVEHKRARKRGGLCSPTVSLFCALFAYNLIVATVVKMSFCPSLDSIFLYIRSCFNYLYFSG